MVLKRGKRWYCKIKTRDETGSTRQKMIRLPEEVLSQLRYGRGLDNRRLKQAGYRFRFTSREAAINHAEALRARPLLKGQSEPYRYEREVEEFLRWSPSVRRKGTV